MDNKIFQNNKKIESQKIIFQKNEITKSDINQTIQETQSLFLNKFILLEIKTKDSIDTNSSWLKLLRDNYFKPYYTKKTKENFFLLGGLTFKSIKYILVGLEGDFMETNKIQSINLKIYSLLEYLQKDVWNSPGDNNRYFVSNDLQFVNSQNPLNTKTGNIDINDIFYDPEENENKNEQINTKNFENNNFITNNSNEKSLNQNHNDQKLLRHKRAAEDEKTQRNSNLNNQINNINIQSSIKNNKNDFSVQNKIQSSIKKENLIDRIKRLYPKEKTSDILYDLAYNTNYLFSKNDIEIKSIASLKKTLLNYSHTPYVLFNFKSNENISTSPNVIKFRDSCFKKYFSNTRSSKFQLGGELARPLQEVLTLIENVLMNTNKINSFSIYVYYLMEDLFNKVYNYNSEGTQFFDTNDKNNIDNYESNFAICKILRQSLELTYFNIN